MNFNTSRTYSDHLTKKSKPVLCPSEAVQRTEAEIQCIWTELQRLTQQLQAELAQAEQDNEKRTQEKRLEMEQKKKEQLDGEQKRLRVQMKIRKQEKTTEEGAEKPTRYSEQNNGAKDCWIWQSTSWLR